MQAISFTGPNCDCIIQIQKTWGHSKWAHEEKVSHFILTSKILLFESVVSFVTLSFLLAFHIAFFFPLILS